MLLISPAVAHYFVNFALRFSIHMVYADIFCFLVWRII
jgi:hypothetical protein